MGIRRLAGILALGLGLGLSGCSAEGEVAPKAVSAEETEASRPDFTLPGLDGNPVALSSFRGKTVVVDFWATWCPPCVFQVPELNKLSTAHEAAADLVVIGVAVDVEGAEVVAPWVEEQGVDYTILIGDESIARDFGAVGFPTLAIIKPDGSVDSLHVGLIELSELEELVAEAAGGRAS